MLRKPWQVALALSVAAGFVWAAEETKQPNWARVQYFGARFTVTNTGKDDWTASEFQLFVKGRDNPFRSRGTALKAGMSYTFESLLFVDGTGKVFDYHSMLPREFIVTATTKRGVITCRLPLKIKVKDE